MPLKAFKADIIPQIKELNVYTKKNLLSTAMSGELTSSLKGRGVEFEDYRDYTPADDAKRIDWRASKRAQRILVREYKLEINFSVFFLIDTSETMLFASTPKLKCEYAAEVVTSMFYGILRTGNSVGFGLFNDKLFFVTKPILGNKQFYMFTKEISDPKKYGGAKNLGKALKQTITFLDRRSLIFIVSDFLGLDNSWVQFFKMLCTKHEVIGVMVRDPRDISIPKDSGQFVLMDPSTSRKLYIDAKDYANVYEQHNQKELRLLRTLFQQNKANLLELNTSEPALNQILTFFKKRGGRWR